MKTLVHRNGRSMTVVFEPVVRANMLTDDERNQERVLETSVELIELIVNTGMLVRDGADLRDMVSEAIKTLAVLVSAVGTGPQKIDADIPEVIDKTVVYRLALLAASDLYVNIVMFNRLLPSLEGTDKLGQLSSAFVTTANHSMGLVLSWLVAILMSDNIDVENVLQELASDG